MKFLRCSGSRNDFLLLRTNKNTSLFMKGVLLTGFQVMRIERGTVHSHHPGSLKNLVLIQTNKITSLFMKGVLLISFQVQVMRMEKGAVRAVHSHHPKY